MVETNDIYNFIWEMKGEYSNKEGIFNELAKGKISFFRVCVEVLPLSGWKMKSR